MPCVGHALAKILPLCLLSRHVPGRMATTTCQTSGCCGCESASRASSASRRATSASRPRAGSTGRTRCTPIPDYSAAYVVLRTDADDGLEGHGLTFTSGRGTEVCVAAARALEPLVVGRTLEGIVGDMSGFWRSLVSDSQLRWLGPEKGVDPPGHGRGRQRRLGPVGQARGQAALEAARRSDARGARRLRRLPLHHRRACARRRRSTSCATRGAGRAAREAEIVAAGYPAYTTSAGWLGYDDDKVEALVREAVAAGFTHVKMKVGARPRVGRPPRRA